MGNLVNQTPTSITTRSVVYNGLVLSGSENVRIHFGGNDGLQVAANWAAFIDIGTVSGFFSFTITGLTPGFIYHITISDTSNADWANTVGSPAPVFSTLNEPQAIPNALSGSRLRAHIRSPLGQKMAEPICPQQFVASISGILTDATSILTCYSVTNSLITLDYTKNIPPANPTWTQTWTTNNDNGTLRFTDNGGNLPPPTSEFGLTGLVAVTTPLYSGTPQPAQWWTTRKGTWKFDVSTNINAAAPPVGGGAHYPLTLMALARRTFSSGFPTIFWQDAVGSGVATKTAFTTLRSCCFWTIYFVLGVDVASAPNNTHIATLSVQCTRLSP